MIAELFRAIDAIQAAVGAARAVMDGRHPVLVEDVLAAEGCQCPNPRVVGVHGRNTSCGDAQYQLFEDSIGGYPLVHVASGLDLLAHEADRRDGVRRGPR